MQEASLRQKHSASPSPSQGMAGAFRRARSRFETRSDTSGPSRPGSAAPSAAPSAAASPQKPPRTPKMLHDQAQPVYEAYSPLMLGPPAAHSVQWTAQPSPVRFALQHPYLPLQHLLACSLWRMPFSSLGDRLVFPATRHSPHMRPASCS